MTVGLTDLLDLAISPQIGPVNFFHLRNLLHTIVEHFGIGEIEAQQAEVRGPQSLRSSSEASTSLDSSDSEEDEGWYFQRFICYVWLSLRRAFLKLDSRINNSLQLLVSYRSCYLYGIKYHNYKDQCCLPS